MSSLLYNGLDSISLNNRPYGNLEYEQEIDQVFLWMEDWNLNQINNGIVNFVKESSLSIKRILRTILEPLLHRDYMYHKFDTGADITFSPISTYFTRELYEKLEKDVNRFSKRKQKETFRLKSAHLKTEVDVKNWSKESVLPNIKSKTKIQSEENEQCSKVNKKHLFRDKQLKNARRENYIELNVVNDFDTNNIDHKAYTYDSNEGVRNNDSKHVCSTRSADIHKSHTLTTNPRLANPSTAKKPISNKYLFQSPSRATTLQRSKTQLSFPPIKHTTMHAKVSPTDNSDVFQKFPLSLKANRRHLQDRCYSEESLVTEKSNMNTLRVSCSTPNIRAGRKLSSTMKYDDQVSKVCSWLSSWSEWQEEYFMRMFLKLLSTTQLYFMYAILMVQLYCDIISLLPKDLSLKIFQYLRPRRLITCAKVSKNWKSLCLHDDLWEHICIRKQVVRRSRSSFKSYSQHQKININWRDGRYAMSDFTRQNASITSLDIHEDLLATGSADKLIKIWKLAHGKCILVLEGHQKCVWGLQFVSSLLLISCSNDQTIKIWNLRTGNCTRTIIGHDGAVWCLRLQGEHFVSGSSDRTAKVWALRSCSLVRSFNNHPGGVYAVAMSSDSQRIFTGTIDKTIRVWDLRLQDYVASFQIGTVLGVLAPVSSLSYDKGYLWCACNNEFQVWDIESFRVISTYPDAHKKIECGQIKIWNTERGSGDKDNDGPKGRIVSCGKDGKLKIWSLLSSKPMLTIFLPDESMPFVVFDDVKIVLSCHGQRDATVKMINFSWNV